MKIHNMEQRTPEWFKVRELKMTASKASAIGSCGKGLETLCRELVCNHLSSAEQEHYTNEHIERGVEFEDQARFIYEMETSNTVDEVGFVEYSDYVGCSPDGHVGDDGMVEIKCPSDKVYLDYLVDEKVNSGYVWQMQMQMLATGRKWCDYVVYNPNFERNIIIKRIEADKVKQDKLLDGFKIGEARIKELLEIAK